MNTEPEEEEGFSGVCRHCGTDCGGVRDEFDRSAKLANALREIRELTSRKQLPLTAQIHEIADNALR